MISPTVRFELKNTRNSVLNGESLHAESSVISTNKNLRKRYAAGKNAELKVLLFKIRQLAQAMRKFRSRIPKDSKEESGG